LGQSFILSVLGYDAPIHDQGGTTMAQHIICVAAMVMLIAATTNYADAKDVAKGAAGAAGAAAAKKVGQAKAQKCAKGLTGTAVYCFRN
jgi:hypothetical protein